MDFCGPFPTGEYLLVVMDDFSRFPEVEILHSTAAQSVIPRLDAIFARHGIPEKIRTDNGPPFNSELFDRWCRTIGMHHRKIMPYWPKANGEAERFMRTIEKAVRTAAIEKGSWKQQLYRFLRQYRATPHSTTGTSPAELLYGRKLRTELPTAPESSKKRVTFADQNADPKERLRRTDQRMKAYMKQLADDRNRAKDSEIQTGDRVLIRQPQSNKFTTPYEPTPYEVVHCKGSMITAQRGDRKITRNTTFFKKIPPAPIPEGDDTVSDDMFDDATTVDFDRTSDLEHVAPPAFQMNNRPQRQRRAPAYLQDYVK